MANINGVGHDIDPKLHYLIFKNFGISPIELLYFTKEEVKVMLDTIFDMAK